VGVSSSELEFILNASKAGVRFDRTMLLGRLQFFGIDAAGLEAAFARAGLSMTSEDAVQCLSVRNGFAEPLFERLGAEEVRSLDASAWEGATNIHDLNAPIGSGLKNLFTAVVDGGTLEHVFNFPEALRSAMELVAADGHLLLMSPTNNNDGHGFYQFGPEIFFRALSPENGFKVERCELKESRGAWYEVTDPERIGRRLEFRTRRSATLFVVARRVQVMPVFEHWPQQSDYQRAWSGGVATLSPLAKLVSRSRRVYRPVVRVRARFFYPPFHRSRSRREQFRKARGASS